MLVHHGLHVEIQVDRDDAIGSTDAAGVKDLLLESAVSTIMDLEDSVAAVDADDKVVGYRNWLQLMEGTLAPEVTKGGKTFTRPMNPDRTCTAPVRRGGHAARSLAAVHPPGRPPDDHRRRARRATATRCPRASSTRWSPGSAACATCAGESRLANSRTGSMYVVKPKMHGPDEVAFTVELFSRVEQVLGLPPLTIKVGIMDEERRTTLNLKACIEAARERVAFINTGFLDRTGDEIHTSMLAGPVVRKNDMKGETWIKAYEDSTSTSDWRAACSAGPRSARACGRRPTAWPTCTRPRSATRRPARAAPGCRRRPPPRSTRCTTTRSTCAPGRRSCGAAAAPPAPTC